MLEYIEQLDLEKLDIEELEKEVDRLINFNILLLEEYYRQGVVNFVEQNKEEREKTLKKLKENVEECIKENILQTYPNGYLTWNTKNEKYEEKKKRYSELNYNASMLKFKLDKLKSVNK